ncbi:NADPH oxidase 5 [Hypsibius exemplaris]|uniref:NADPH oxidase 5 n=1 Tax=Hypsibius exemplaris TaxID=2072580 RepID=A0A1W0WUV2_HYPEX|nr:NADPH oxidase 5 [Hypsibius exemplaris]
MPQIAQENKICGRKTNRATVGVASDHHVRKPFIRLFEQFFILTPESLSQQFCLRLSRGHIPTANMVKGSLQRTLTKFSKNIKFSGNDDEDVEKGRDDAVTMPNMDEPVEHFDIFHKTDVGDRDAPSNILEEDKVWLEGIKNRTKDMAPEDQVSLDKFREILEIKKVHKFFAERIYNLMDSQRVGYLTTGQLMGHLTNLTATCSCIKLKMLFNMYDIDGNGTIDPSEFGVVLASAIAYNALSISPEQVESMTDTMFEEIDENSDGVISFDELKLILEKYPQWFDGSLQLSAARFLKPPEAPQPKDKRNEKVPLKVRLANLWTTIRRKRKEVLWGIFYGLSIIAFFLYGSLDAFYSGSHITTPHCLKYYVVAHGFGMNLNWNCMLIIIFMLRRTLTALRDTRLGPYLPIDIAVFIHKVIGYMIGICTLGHWIFHMIHFRCLADEPNPDEGHRNPYTHQPFSYGEYLGSMVTGLGWIHGFVSISGWVLLAIYVVMFIFSLRVIRRSGHFEVFFITHLLYIPFMVLLILHSDKFWKFIIVPGLIYIIEKISMTRCVRVLVGGAFHIKAVTLWRTKDQGVTQIIMNHPPGFVYQPGDYVFVNIPTIANFEWHPFTISSCPEDAENMTLHVQFKDGQSWTKKLYQYFEKLQSNRKQETNIRKRLETIRKFQSREIESAPSVYGKKRPSIFGTNLQALHVPIYVDGPYGTPSGRIFSAQHALLICAGIGVTPFASILQSIMYRHRTRKVTCPECETSFHPPMTAGQEGLKKVQFIWVVPNQRSIEWFVELLDKIDAVQTTNNHIDKLIEIQVYVTSAKSMSDVYSFGLTTALDVFYKKHNRCLVSGIQSRALFGRPDWNTIFQEADENKRGNVSVFFCGSPDLARTLRTLSAKHNFEFAKESF